MNDNEIRVDVFSMIGTVHDRARPAEERLAEVVHALYSLGREVGLSDEELQQAQGLPAGQSTRPIKLLGESHCHSSTRNSSIDTGQPAKQLVPHRGVLDCLVKPLPVIRDFLAGRPYALETNTRQLLGLHPRTQATAGVVTGVEQWRFVFDRYRT